LQPQYFLPDFSIYDENIKNQIPLKFFFELCYNDF
jgi:hypothetical protein